MYAAGSCKYTEEEVVDNLQVDCDGVGIYLGCEEKFIQFSDDKTTWKTEKVVEM